MGKGSSMTVFRFHRSGKGWSGFLIAFLAFFVSPLFLPPTGYAEPPKKSFPVPDTSSKEPERKVTLPASEEEIDQEIARHKMLDLEFIYLLESHLDALQVLKEIRKANGERAVERNEWQGFADPPPFPVSSLEDLYDAIKDKQFERNMVDVRREIAEGQLREYLKNLEHAGAELRLTEERIAAGKEEERWPRWAPFPWRRKGSCSGRT
jgi:hypothetical protein